MQQTASSPWHGTAQQPLAPGGGVQQPQIPKQHWCSSAGWAAPADVWLTVARTMARETSTRVVFFMVMVLFGKMIKLRTILIFETMMFV